MPLTLAHPAAILPLTRLPLPVAPMVIASMVPDIPMFLPGRGGYGATHSLSGVLTVDVLATLLLLCAWNFGGRDALVDLSPGWIRNRFARRVRLSRKDWLLAPPAAALGALTHVVWDAFTHTSRWGVTHVGWLSDNHYGLAGYRWAQYLSGVLGLAIVIWSCLAYIRARPSGKRTDRRTLPVAVLPCVLALATLAATTTGMARLGDGMHDVAFHAVVSGIQIGFVGLALICLIWMAFEIPRRMRQRAEPTTRV